MASLNNTYDVNDMPESQSYEILPDGWYTASITKAEVRDTKDRTGQYIAIRYDITGPTHQGRVVFGNVNIKNKSTVAEDIGRQQLGSLMRAGGLPRLEDTDQLIGINLSIKLKTRQSEGYEPTNDVSGFKAIDGATVPMPATSSAPKAAGSKPAWAK